jgi:hypothetical protein
VINWNVFILKNINCPGNFASHDKREWWCWKFDHKRCCLTVHQHITAFIHYVTWYIFNFLYKNIIKYRMLARIWRFIWVLRRHRKKTNTHLIWILSINTLLQKLSTTQFILLSENFFSNGQSRMDNPETQAILGTCQNEQNERQTKIGWKLRCL